MSVELISAIFTGLTGLLAGLAAVLAQRARRVGEDGRYWRREARELHRWKLAALGHMNKLEEILVRAGRPVPKRPPVLEGDDDDGTSQPAGAHAAP